MATVLVAGMNTQPQCNLLGVPQYYQHALGDDVKNVLELVSPGHIFVLVPKSREFKAILDYLTFSL